MAVNEEVLTFKVATDIQGAIKDMAKFQKQMLRQMQAITKSSEKMAKTTTRSADDSRETNEDLLGSVEDLTEAYEEEAESVDELVELQDKMAKASGKERVALDKQLKQLNKKRKEGKEEKKQLTEKIKLEKAWVKVVGKKVGGPISAKDIAGTLKEGFGIFLDKNAKGLAENLGKLLKQGISKGGFGLFKRGEKMKAEGAAMKAAGAAQGGLGGFNKAAGGAATAGIGKLLGGLAKAAPLLTTIASILVKVVTLFIDAEAQAKAFNKSILESASTAEFYGAAMGHAATAGDDLENTLRGIRDAAFDAKTNLDWGITEDTHQQVLNTLTQEGVSLQSMARDAKTSGKSMEQFGAQIATVSVAYSRLLGVPIQEIGQLQAEMVRDMGMGIEETRLSFASMTKAALESGMGANKFFAILRGVSADLSLFNLRIAEAAKFLKQVGKSMSARSAQEFLNTIKNFYKGMGLQERIKSTMLAGQGATKGILQKDIARKQTGLAADVEAKLGPEAGKELAAAMKAGPKETARFLAKNGDKLEAGMKESILDAQRMQAKVSRGGIVDLASALKDLDPMGAVEHLDAVSKNMFEKPMEKLTDVEMLAFTQMTGMSDQQLDMMAKFKAGLDITREEISARVEDGTKITEEDKKLMERLGITGTNAERAEKLRHTDTKKIYENMSKEEKDKLTETAKTMEDYAKEQGKLSQSLEAKLGILVNFLTQQFYNLIIDIYDALPFGDRDKKDAAKAMKVAFQSGNQVLIEALKEGGSREEMTGKLLATETGQKAISTIRGGPQAEGFADVAGSVAAQLSTRLNKEGSKLGADPETKKLFEEMTGKDSDTLMKLLQQGKELAPAFKEMGLDQEKYNQFLQAGLKKLSPEQLTHVLSKVKPAETKGATETGEVRTGTTTVEQPGAPVTGVRTGTTTVERPGAPAAVQAAATPPPASAPPAPVVMPEPPKEVAAWQEQELDMLGTLGGKNDDIIKVLKRKVKLDKTFVSGELGPQIEESVLAAVRVALIEYKLYKDVEMDQFVDAVQDVGFDPKKLGQDLLKNVREKKRVWKPGEEGGGRWEVSEAQQAGGYIIGQNPDGTAKVLRPPAGEMPTYIGPGETIVPKGGRGGTSGINVSIAVNGVGGNDLAQMVKVAATNAIYDYKRREGLH